MSKKTKLTAALLAGSLASFSVLSAFSQTYTPQYDSSYSSGYEVQRSYQNLPAPSAVGQNYQPNYANYQNVQPVQQTTNYTQQAGNYAQTNVPSFNQTYMPPLQGTVVTVPAGTMMYAATTSSISSAYTTVGDTVSLSLGSPLYFNGVMIVPAGSMVQGNVVVAQKAGMAGKHGQLKIKFTNVITPSGQRIPISGKIQTEDGTGILIGGTGKDRLTKVAKNTAVGAGSGALFGTVIGAISGNTGKGAWSGTAVGAGLGAGKSVIEKGEDVVLNAGSQVDIQLDQPLTVNPSQTY
ncbi:MAG: hypothetical protein PHV68_02465 [Candidatus Gastranaerophilales bacterium]|nr:hypothetical protein [Candidatus Gastranaerophilales bacterium]